MEDWTAFTDCFSPFLLFDLPWLPEDAPLKAIFEAQWSKLRRATLFVMRHHEGQHTEERICEMETLMVDYGKSVVEVRLPRSGTFTRDSPPHTPLIARNDTSQSLAVTNITRRHFMHAQPLSGLSCACVSSNYISAALVTQVFPSILLVLDVSRNEGVQTYGGKLATFKLHCAARHIPDQLRCCGPGAHHLELWIERMVGYMKEDVRARVRQFPELTFVKGHLMHRATLRRRRQHPDHCLSIDEHRKAGRQMPFPSYDQLHQCDEASVLLLGKRADGWDLLDGGKSPAAVAAAASVDAEEALDELDFILFELPRAIAKHPNKYAEQGWPLVLQAGLRDKVEAGDLLIDKFRKCSLSASDLMSCEQDTSQPTSDNRWAYCEFTATPNSTVLCVAQVQCYVRVAFASHAVPTFGADDIDVVACQSMRPPLPGTQPRDNEGRVRKSSVLRFALVKLWHLSVCDSSAVGGLTVEDPVTGQLPDLFCVPDISELQSNLVSAAPASHYLGLRLVDAADLRAQLVPTKVVTLGEAWGRFFMTVHKSSGRL